MVGTISPVTAISPRTASVIMHNHPESSQARIDLTADLDESFKNSAFNHQQKTQLLDLCTRYRSVFSLNQEQLGRCTIAGVTARFGEGGGKLHRRRARGVLNPCARESKARTGRFLSEKLISDHAAVWLLSIWSMEV